MDETKFTPRFLPTLTEVVKPVDILTKAAASQTTELHAQTSLTEDALVAAVMARLMPALELQIQKALRQSLNTQVERMLPAVLADMDVAVRAALGAMPSMSPEKCLSGVVNVTGHEERYTVGAGIYLQAT